MASPSQTASIRTTFQELAALYDLKLCEKSLLTFYVAPEGDPAIGPTAYPHRASASEYPRGTLGPHQEDSTHIANDVVTVGFTHGLARIEASGFHGREPDEHRWNIHQGKIDPWSTRLTGQNWSGQHSYARIKNPVALFPSEDQERMTASVMYNKPLTQVNCATRFFAGERGRWETQSKRTATCSNRLSASKPATMSGGGWRMRDAPTSC